MHTSLTRLQNVFGFFTTVACCVAVVIALSVVVTPQSPSASLQLQNVQVVKGRPHYYSTKKEEYAHIRFDLDADLSSLFSWNTKQVFLYITTTFPSTSSREPPSQAVIWDAILPSKHAPWHYNQYIHPPTSSAPPSSSSSSSKSKPKPKSTGKPAPQNPEDYNPGLLQLSGQRPKYQITVPSGRVASTKNATLELNWNVQPWVGALTWTNRQDWGVWKGLRGGRSKSFDFPALKGSEAAAAGTGAKKQGGDLKTEKGAEGNRGKPA
ncbi:MAG: hypothetical protein M1822_002769 [Bathelium mastoideum]|nr:MAG: hypothetical protein M1822_002769 [Bathelium mastoideum]